MWRIRIKNSLAIAASLVLALEAVPAQEPPAPGLEVTLAWDANLEPDIEGYRLHYGTAQGSYPNAIDVGNSTNSPLTLPEPGTYYSIVTAYNTAGVESPASNEVIISVPANIPPLVTLTAPSAESTFEASSSITISATATDSDGSISKIEFYVGGTKLGEALAAPFTLDWLAAATGSYTLTARAFDNAGAWTDSPSIAVTIIESGSGPQTYSATLAWDPNPEPDIVGYHLSYGTSHGSYSTVIDTGNATSRTLLNLVAGTYYAIVTAYNTAGLESPASNELVFSVPVPAPDTTNPVISGIPGNIVTVPDTLGGTSAVVSWIEPTATDNVGIISLTSTHGSGDTFPAGTTTVVYTATDAAGNLSTASFTITVTSIELWRLSAFGSAGFDAEIAGDTANPDGDFWDNLAEYALGLDPLVRDGDSVTSLSLQADEVQFHLSHAPRLPDVTLIVESFVPQAGEWRQLAVRSPTAGWILSDPEMEDLEVVSVPNGELIDVTLTKSIQGIQGEFFRLSIVRMELP
ncbi:MAG: hypothetical protein ACI8T1_001056 [Verrucomicrobiales bacterium]|jgi:hypothetical protein